MMRFRMIDRRIFRTKTNGQSEERGGKTKGISVAASTSSTGPHYIQCRPCIEHLHVI